MHQTWHQYPPLDEQFILTRIKSAFLLVKQSNCNIEMIMKLCNIFVEVLYAQESKILQSINFTFSFLFLPLSPLWYPSNVRDSCSMQHPSDTGQLTMILQQQSSNYRCLQQMRHCWQNLLHLLISIKNWYLATEAIKNYTKGAQSWVIGKAYW